MNQVHSFLEYRAVSRLIESYTNDKIVTQHTLICAFALLVIQCVKTGPTGSLLKSGPV